MTEKDQKAAMKVSRPRRRLYEALPEIPEAAPSASPAEPAATHAPVPAPELNTEHFAREMVVKRFARMTMGTALIPLPLVDWVAGTAVQMKMIKTLSELYRVEFSEQRTRAIIGSLIGGFHIGLLTGSIFKAVPVIGLAGGVVSLAALSYGITYALGVIFIRHFEAGGTLLNFNTQKARREFPQACAEGREKAAALPADH
jgi:uncharacterized protein (DUF697 family)